MAIQSRVRLTELDSLRGVAAVSVVLYHYTCRYHELFGHKIDPIWSVDFGKQGVKLFFLISGFVIFMTLNRTRYVKHFVLSRIIRLFPAYWCAVLITFVVVSISELTERKVSIQDALINLTMLQYWFSVPSVDGVYWTLNVELSFYVLIAFIYFVVPQAYFDTAMAFWLLTECICLAVDQLFTVDVPGKIRQLLVLDYGHLFIAGIMFYKIYSQKCKWLYCYVVIAFCLEILISPATTIICGAYFIAFIFLVNGRLGFLSNKVLVFLGSISYSLYLIHQNVGYVIIYSLYKHGFASPISVILVPLFFSLLLASFMFLFIERPSLLALKSRLLKA
ncbi:MULTISPECIES: acyltransferase family protein [Methylomonas]|uniref:Acyltransferase 3 domain-containing protein n=1 Tax=Methylomonas koyamae TaxID=702114 RepID=A0A177PD78_9GAMM|nr:acyltransferase [Methylomonas koyamae]OAI28337.1 hypothetical protein A1355_01250 [Methylomonas koyamae]